MLLVAEVLLEDSRIHVGNCWVFVLMVLEVLRAEAFERC